MTSREWAIKNKEYVKELQKDWEMRNYEERRKYKQKYYQEHKDTIRKSCRSNRLKRKYGVTDTQYEAMFKEQGEVCAICKKETKDRLRVDHCHKTKAVRGLLCHNCNTGIGHFRDSVELLNTAIEYLLK